MGSVGSTVFDLFMDASGLGDILGGLMTVIILPIVIWNTLVCLFGYKLFKIQLAIIGFLFGAALGAALGAIGGQAIFAVLLGLVLGALGAWLSLKLYKIGVFIMVSSSSALILTVLFGLLLQSVNAGVVAFAALLGIGLGVLGVLFDKYVIILYTAISGGMLAGIGLGLSMGNVVIGVFIGVLLAALGVWLQFRMERKNGGQPVSLAPASAALTTAPKAAPALALGDMAKSLTASAKGATDLLMSKVGKHENLNPNQTVLVSNKGNYWCTDMPLVVTEVQVASQAGDDEHVYLNIALQNLSDQPIVGIYFDVTCQNLLKQELEGLVNLSVLDLHIAEGQHWFTTTSMRLPDKTTRKCLLTVKNVVLGNEEIWSNEQGLPLTDIPAAAALALSSELAEEYHLQLAEQQKMRNAAAVYTYAPSFAAEHWYCSCGQLNTTSSRCVCCAMGKDALAGLFDQSKLQADREQRIAEKLRIEEERRQKIAEQTEAVKQKSLELAGQAKQGYAAAANKTSQLYGVAAAKAKAWYAAAKVFVVGHKKQVLAGAGAVAVVVIGGVAIKAVLDAPPKSAAVTPSSSSASSAIPTAGSAASESGSSDQAALLEQQKQEEKRQYEVKQAKAYLELMNGLLQTHQFDFGEGSLGMDGYMYDTDNNLYCGDPYGYGIYVGEETPAIFFAQQMDMDNNGSQELVLVLGDKFLTSVQIWGFDGTACYQIAEQSLGQDVKMGQSPEKGSYIVIRSREATGSVVFGSSTFYWLENGELCARSTSYTDNSRAGGTDQATINYFVDDKSVPESQYQSVQDMFGDNDGMDIVSSTTGMAPKFEVLIDSGRLTRSLMASLYQTVLTDLALQEGNTPTQDVDLTGIWTSCPLNQSEEGMTIYEMEFLSNQTFVDALYTTGGGVGNARSIGYCLLAGDTLYLAYGDTAPTNVRRLTLIQAEDTLILPVDFFEGRVRDCSARELQKTVEDDTTYLGKLPPYRSDPLPRGGGSTASSKSDANFTTVPTATDCNKDGHSFYTPVVSSKNVEYYAGSNTCLVCKKAAEDIISYDIVPDVFYNDGGYVEHVMTTFVEPSLSERWSEDDGAVINVVWMVENATIKGHGIRYKFYDNNGDLLGGDIKYFEGAKAGYLSPHVITLPPKTAHVVASKQLVR